MVLARALEVNTKSEELWKAYLHFYLHQERTPSATEIRDLFESAVNFLPRSYCMWRMYVPSTVCGIVVRVRCAVVRVRRLM